jgi:hypothetical protein
MSTDTVESTAYNGDPPFVAESETSKEAAHRMEPNAATLRADVLRFFVYRGERGATDEEVQTYLPLASNPARPRRRELEIGGYVVRTDSCRKTRAGRWAHVYEVTSAGLTWAAMNALGEGLES